jgi:hypothetical protein
LGGALRAEVLRGGSLDLFAMATADNEVIEIRQVQELADFPPDVQEAAGGFAEMQAEGRAGSS